MVTRRPLEMRLKHLDSLEDPAFAVFDEDPEKEKLTDFELVT